MLIKDKDILSNKVNEKVLETAPTKSKIDKKNMRSAWGDAFDYYIRGITEKYLYFSGRATRIEFFGFVLASFIVFFVLYGLGVYVDVPLLAYYYLVATMIPCFAVFTRRFHDIGKKPLVYMILGVISLLSAIVLGWFSLLLVCAWLVIIFKMLLKKGDIEENIFGQPVDDEIYDDDNELIVRKFFVLALSFEIIFLLFTGLNFDNWKRQNEQRQTINSIMEKVVEVGEKNGLKRNQISEAQSQVRSILRGMQGLFVEQKDIDNMIENTVKSLSSNGVNP